MAYGFLGLKPNEFWSYQPKDIIKMSEGFQMKREYKEALHRETLELLRYIGYTEYVGIPTKQRKSRLEKYYPLRWDNIKTYTKEEIEANSNLREPIITNGKLRGYLNTLGELWDKKEDGKVIAYMRNEVLEYIN